MTAYPYNTNIPNPPADPADDVSIMQTNAGSLASFLAVDHSPFVVSNNNVYNGQHKQVTFSLGFLVDPTIPIGRDVNNNYQGFLYTFPDASNNNQLYYVTGSTNDQAINQYYISSAGGGTGQTESSAFLLGGLIIKTGRVQVANGPVAVNFVAAFPNACLTVVAQPINSGGPGVANDYVYVSAIGSASSFNATATRRTTLANNTVIFCYTAIGY
jgi:hypothetical protein